MGKLEVAVDCKAASMNNFFWNALVVEVIDLLSEHEVFKEHGAALSCRKRILAI